MNEQSISYYSAHLSVCNILTVNQSDSMQIMILTIVYETRCMWVILAWCKKSEEKNSHAQVFVGLMWHLFVKLSGKTAEIRWGINIRCGMGHRSQRGPQWAVYCKNGAAVAGSPHLVESLSIWRTVDKYLQKCSFRGTIWHLLCKRTNSVTHWNASKHLAIPISNARLTTGHKGTEHFVSKFCCEKLTRFILWT